MPKTFNQRHLDSSLPPSAPVDRDAVEGNIRIAIWNACMKGGMGQDLSLALIERAMSEAMMSRALPPSVLAESTSNDCLLVAEAVRDACAKACEDQAREFLSPQYATPQPIGSVQERFACAECGYAIRSLDLSGVGVG